MLHLNTCVLLRRHPYRIIKSSLARKVQPFLRRGTATQHYLLAVKVLDDSSSGVLRVCPAESVVGVADINIPVM